MAGAPAGAAAAESDNQWAIPTDDAPPPQADAIDHLWASAKSKVLAFSRQQKQTKGAAPLPTPGRFRSMGSWGNLHSAEHAAHAMGGDQWKWTAPSTAVAKRAIADGDEEDAALSVEARKAKQDRERKERDDDLYGFDDGEDEVVEGPGKMIRNKTQQRRLAELERAKAEKRRHVGEAAAKAALRMVRKLRGAKGAGDQLTDLAREREAHEREAHGRAEEADDTVTQDTPWGNLNEGRGHGVSSELAHRVAEHLGTARTNVKEVEPNDLDERTGLGRSSSVGSSSGGGGSSGGGAAGGDDEAKPRRASLDRNFYSTRQKASLDQGSTLSHLDGWDDDGASPTKEHPRRAFVRASSQAKFDALQQMKIQQENEGGGGGGGSAAASSSEERPQERAAAASSEEEEREASTKSLGDFGLADDVRSTPSLTTEAEEDAAGPSQEEETQDREASTKSLGDYLSDDGSSVREADKQASAPAPSDAMLSAITYQTVQLSTMWPTLLYAPLGPTFTFLVERKRKGSMGFVFNCSTSAY